MLRRLALWWAEWWAGARERWRRERRAWRMQVLAEELPHFTVADYMELLALVSSDMLLRGSVRASLEASDLASRIARELRVRDN